MVEYAEHEWRLSRKRDDGASERDHLESAARQFEKWGGRKPKVEVVPEGPPFPDALEYLWRWFNDLSIGIASTGMAPAQVTWRDVVAWAGMTGRKLETWEARALVALGFARAAVASEDLSKTKPKMPDTPTKSTKPRRR